ncbi:REP-associated tyrosine transposase [Alienimonas chondri]|uniref:Transposase IS200-like domain-containing protein n=1 Tax=Alienimonas chondri TaxID=2681879 RepID=A0ABX1VDU5_9PLAN|nr:transposase [Alienimonas chondri]NNJ26077.1 hypothetical protein [Alienimonas chondri]
MSRTRLPRRTFNEPGHAHELTFSTYRRLRFLERDRVRGWFADALALAREKHDVAVWTYVLMPEHVHLLVHPRRRSYSIEAFRHDLKAPVGRRAFAHLEEHAPHWLPQLTRRRGKKTERLFWQPGAGYDRNVTEPKTLAAMIDYIHANPVRRGLCERPEDWMWSGARCFAGQDAGPIPLDPIPPEWGVTGP